MGLDSPEPRRQRVATVVIGDDGTQAVTEVKTTKYPHKQYFVNIIIHIIRCDVDQTILNCNVLITITSNCAKEVFTSGQEVHGYGWLLLFPLSKVEFISRLEHCIG